MGQVFKTYVKGKKSYWRGEIANFLLEKKNSLRQGEKRNKSKLLFSIYGVPSIGIRRAKNKSSSTRQGLRVGNENMGFRGGFKQGIREIKDFGFKKCPRVFLKFLVCSKR